MKKIKVLSSLLISIFQKRKIVLYHHSNILIKKKAKLNVKDVLHIGKKWNTCDNQYTSFCIGKNSQFYTDKLTIYDGCKITIKDNAILSIKSGYLNSNVQINVKKSVSIGEKFACANGVVIRDNNAHSINGKIDYKPISIGNHCWIGTKAIILPGAKIGDNCVVAAGSVVNKEFPNNCLIGGIPAKIIKENIMWGDAVDEEV